MFPSYIRIGGLRADLPVGSTTRSAPSSQVPDKLKEYEDLLTKNRSGEAHQRRRVLSRQDVLD